MEPLPDNWNDEATGVWLPATGWTTQLAGPDGLATLPLVSVELAACMGGAGVIIGGVKVLHDGVATDTEDLEALYGLTVLEYHPPTAAA